jgi:uncharacterized protein YbjT (DUF2867 family)
MTTLKNPTILITGATGNVGSELCRQLTAQGTAFRVMVRSAESAERLSLSPGTEVVIADIGDENRVKVALTGIEKAFLLTHSSEDAEHLQTNFTDIAARTGIKHIVKLSQWAASLHSPVRFLRYHAAVEEKIQQSGLAFTFLRPNLFMQGLLSFKHLIATQGKFYAAVGNAKISAVDVRDIAAVAARVLTEGEQHYNKIYNLTGPESITHQQMAASLAKATHKPVEFVDIAPEYMLKAVLSAGLPAWQAEGLVEDYEHYAKGEAAYISTDVKKITGCDPINFETFANDYAHFFKS